MIPNIVVLDSNFVDSEGCPNKYADMYNQHVVVHPEYFRMWYEKIIESYGNNGCRIITMEEWTQMNKYSYEYIRASSEEEKKKLVDAYNEYVVHLEQMSFNRMREFSIGK